MTNLAVWDKLSKTDPKHTKPFNRAGGFKGTAIKPIYTEHKMTETFGPCGVGWGFSEPQFQTVSGSDGQVAVYCWLTLWYRHEDKVSAPVPGVGGDMVVVKQSSGLRTDDEAFKKAFTDAIGNAMKHVGMSADVHMGLFDDSKYVNERANEEAAAAPQKSPPAPPKPRLTESEGATKLRDRLADQLKAAAQDSMKKLAEVWKANQPDIKRLPEKLELELVDLKEALKSASLVRAG